MSLSIEQSFERCCRLCAEEQEATIMIFSAEAEAMLLQNKLNKYLLIEVDEDDKLPKNICLKCCATLQTVSDFVDSAHKAQDILLNRSILLDQYKTQKWNGNLDSDLEIKTIADLYTWEHFKRVKSDTSITQENIKTECDTKPQKKKKSKSNNKKNDDSPITEMEVSVDPMLILQNAEESISPNVDSVENNSENYNYGENVTIKLIKKVNTDNLDTGSTAKPFPCHTCSRAFITELALKNHSWVHSDGRSKTYKCTNCLEGFDYKWDFIEHLKQHKVDGMCQLCGRVFRSDKSLEAHMDIHKSTNKSYTCKVCFRSYNTKSNLKTHSITHSNDRPYDCHICKKSFKRNQDLKFHINQHTGAKPYKCPFCDKCFASSGNCYSHRSRMHPGRHGESLRRRASNKQQPQRTLIPAPQLSSKTPLVAVKGIFKFQCNLCDHSFMKRDNFLYHTYKHTGEKPFQCTFCTEKFVTRQGLMLHHNKSHPTQKPPLAYISKNALLQ